MKALGIVRNVDNLGRIVIPKETRKLLNINEGDPVEMFIDGDIIMLRKYHTSCVFCGEQEDLVEYSGKAVCAKCIDSLGGR